MKKCTYLILRTLCGLMLSLLITLGAFAQTNTHFTHHDSVVISQVDMASFHHANLDDNVEIHTEKKHAQHKVKDFHVVAHPTHISLHWEVKAIEYHNGFEVEHSLDGNTWVTLGTVKEIHSRHHENHHYHFSVKALQSDHHTFRLKNLGMNDNHMYSHPISIEIDDQETHRIVSIFPNHFHKNFHMTLSLNHAQKVAIHIMDEKGHALSTLFEGEMSDHATHGLSFSLADFTSESHTLRIHGEDFHLHHHLDEKTN